jgi:hypothetical protein
MATLTLLSHTAFPYPLLSWPPLHPTHSRSLRLWARRWRVQSSTTTARMGPGGVAEIQSQERDGRGQERIMMERRIGDRGRRVEKTINRHTGEEETADNTYGIEDGMEDHFDREFQTVLQQGPRFHLLLMC